MRNDRGVSRPKVGLRRISLRRIALTALVMVPFAWAASGPVRHFASLVGADDWGSDWLWLQDGLQRLAAGLPLTRPEYVAGPFTQFANGPAYTWSLHPPSTATLIAPGLLLPLALRQAAWTWLMGGALALAAWLAWPRRLWWGTQLLLAAVVLGPPFQGLSVGLVDQVHFANPDALVVLAVPVTWLGRRRGSAGLMALGLVLAAVKILPAVALGGWLLASRPAGRGALGGLGLTLPDRPVRLGFALAAGAMLALTLPILALDHGALADTLAAAGNLVPWDGPSNLAPGVSLAGLLGAGTAALLGRVVGVALIGLVVARRLGGAGGLVIAAAAPLLLTPQLWAHWFLIPAAAMLIWSATWPPLRGLDARLRSAWAARPAIPVAPRPGAT